MTVKTFEDVNIRSDLDLKLSCGKECIADEVYEYTFDIRWNSDDFEADDMTLNLEWMIPCVDIQYMWHPESRARRSPRIIPLDRLSKKKHRIPASTISMATASPLPGLFPKNRNCSSMIQIGAVYCRMIVFPAVVSLLAMANSVVTPIIHSAPTNTVKFHLSR